MQLDALQQALEARFEQLSGERAGSARVFVLEHGLAVDMRELAEELSKQIRYGNLRADHWLVWVVFATEVGYRFAGTEYWRTFGDRLPAWKYVDTNPNRSQIRVWFRKFAHRYNGVRPSGTWARQFSIIAWPITHAILPKDLQYHFAKSLHSHRFRLASENDPLSIGQLIHRQLLPTSSRFREFSEQEELVGRIALALLGAGSQDMPLSPDVTRRIVVDLERTQAAKDWLQEAREIRRIRGVKRQRHSERTRQERQEIPRFSLTPGLILSNANNVWKVGMLVPSLAPLASQAAEVREFLLKTKVQLQGGAGTWQPARVLMGSERPHILQRWPEDDVVVRFKDANPILEHLINQGGPLGKGPFWLCKVGSDGMARHVRQNRVRAGHQYVVLAKVAHDFPASRLLEPIELQCVGIKGVRFSLPRHVPDDTRHLLKSLGVVLASTAKVWPAGMPAVSWDGEGCSEWLTTDAPCFGIEVDHDVAAVEVSLNDESRITIPRRGVSGPSWLQLPSLPSGQHSLKFEIKDGDSGLAIVGSSGEMLLEVRDPLTIEETVHQRGGLMVIATPSDATLDDLEHGRLALEMFGPRGREVRVRMEVDSPSALTVQVGKFELPEALSGVGARLADDAQEVLGVSSLCRLIVDAEEIGCFTLPLERISRPVRWVIARTKQDVKVRLIDEAGLGAHADCQMVALESPAASRSLSYDDCIDGIKVPPLGALYVVAGKGRIDAVIVTTPSPQRCGDLASLIGFTPRLDGYGTSFGSLKEDIQLLTLWSKARVVGPLAPARQQKIARTMRDALTRLVCGAAWIHAEQSYERSCRDQDAIANLGDVVTANNAHRSFAAKLRMSHHEAREKSPAEVVSWLLAIASAFGVCGDPGRIDAALRFFTDPAGFVARSGNVESDVRALASDGDLARGIRYLQILLEGRSWDWN